MISFILNNQSIDTDKSAGISLLDFIRYDQDLPGTKIGCREGDCGACTVLEGSLVDGKLIYKSIVSCLTPLGNVHGKHIVTIEGINMDILSPVQSSFVKNAATQCGFCTPGFVMSLTGHSLSYEKSTKQKAIASISGNICRCTGYKSIEKASEDISLLLKDKNIDDPLMWLVKNKFLPKYFLEIHDRLLKIPEQINYQDDNRILIAGGTDLMVQKSEVVAESSLYLINHQKEFKGISLLGDKCIIGASTTATDIEKSSVVKKYIPQIVDYFALISSESIRNMGTVAGNIVNASPIGDLIIIMLMLDADVTVRSKKIDRSIPLKDFFLGYKKLAMEKEEQLTSISFKLPNKGAHINFEKVSKREHLDIASVNSAILIENEGSRITKCNLSAGGVSPIPLFLDKTSVFLIGKEINIETLKIANEVMQAEISPISDIRGSIDYKRLLLRQVLYAHFIKLFPNKIMQKDIIAA